MTIFISENLSQMLHLWELPYSEQFEKKKNIFEQIVIWYFFYNLDFKLQPISSWTDLIFSQLNGWKHSRKKATFILKIDSSIYHSCFRFSFYISMDGINWEKIRVIFQISCVLVYVFCSSQKGMSDKIAEALCDTTMCVINHSKWKWTLISVSVEWKICPKMRLSYALFFGLYRE